METKFARTVSKSKDLAVSKPNVLDWHERVTEEVHPETFHAGLIFNPDETWLNEKSKKGGGSVLVVVPKGKPAIRTVPNEESDLHITLLITTCADGSFLQPLIILPTKNLPPELADYALKYGFSFTHHQVGWMTGETFLKWIREFFIPQVQAKRKALNLPPTEKALLFMDCHSSREQKEIYDECDANNIKVCTIPAGTSHVLQPNDCGVNGAFKQKLRKYKQKYVSGPPAITAAQKRKRLFELMEKALYESMFHGIIQDAWARAGIWPWDFTAKLKSKYVGDGQPINISKFST